MISDSEKKRLLFAHDEIRDSQESLILKIDNSIRTKRNLVVCAPTGLGKTAASLGPALSYALENEKTVFFLTSRNTQHKIALETLKKIKDKYNLEFDVVDLIARKSMCPVPGIESLYSQEFTEYCKTVREDDKCEFYVNTKTGMKETVKAKQVISEIKKFMPTSSDKIYELSSEAKLCPYEISILIARKARVIIGDYYYIFHPSIRDAFFSKSEKAIEDSIIIVDEAHNLPNRIKDLATERLTNIILKRAIQEARKFQLQEIIDTLVRIQDIILDYASSMKRNDEKLISKDDFLDKLKSFCDVDNFISTLEVAAINIREEQKQSYLGSIASFLESWNLGGDEGFVRIFSTKEAARENVLTLSYRCLDPSIITSNVINNSHCTILMSGTLNPTSMYAELLGMSRYDEETFKSPFPKENRLNLIVPGVSTKFSTRSDEEFKKIAEACAKIANNVPGNTAIFFPSYFMLDAVSKKFDILSEKTVIKELSGMDNDEKAEILENFKNYKSIGAVLLGVISGSFGEGIDLPGDFLKCVVIVGLPLSQPDLETKSLIDYYDKKFKRGWDYGYVAPAFNKTLQGAGRCIRSETDKGVIVFLDERYSYDNYFRYFPKEWDMKITSMIESRIKSFFENKK